MQLFDLVRSLPDQARLALGTSGVIWATAAGAVGLLCCAISMASIALSLQATEAGYTRHKAADLLGLDQSTRQLMHSVHLLTYDQLQPAEAEASLRKAWARFEAALADACGQANSASSNVARQPAICAEATAMHDLLKGEIKAFGPPSRLLDRATLGKAIVLLGRFNAASAADARNLDALIGKLVDDYGWALLVLTLSTAGFVCAGLVLILLVGRASMEHQRQWQDAGEARDLETIDSLPAGVVVYDQRERLVMFNAAALASTPVLKRPGTDAVRGAVDLTGHGLRQQQTTLSASLPDDLPPVIGHVGRLEQVLVNLINNARDAGGRTISVAASTVERGGRPLVRIAVEDSGPGIAPEVLLRLFVAFVTTKARGKGTGLGLRICRRIVEEMDSEITARNRPEGGACFEILLPAAVMDA
jgi:Histidine kinase-, DNA gyrase B-, and HSP90-like ATPase